MLFMLNIDMGIDSLLQQLGTRLKDARLARNESQVVFAARLGLTRQSYSKMEKGAASVAIGYWLLASDLLDRLQTWEQVLSEKEDLFATFERKNLKRKRASSKRIKGK